MVWYITGEKYLCCKCRMCSATRKKLPHGKHCVLRMHSTVIFRDMSVIKTLDNLEFSTKHHYLNATSQKYSMLMWRIAPRHSGSEFHSLYRYILRDVWSKKCPVSYDTVFCKTWGLLLLYKSCRLHFSQTMVSYYTGKIRSCCNFRVFSASTTVVMNAYSGFTGCI